MSDLYATLGVSKSATPDEMKRAHRKKVKKFHPDVGGNPEQFKAVQKAYDILSNPQRKQLYDETGKEDETAFDPELEVAKLICQIVEQNNVRTEDIVRIARNHLAGVVKNGEQQFVEANKRAEKFLEAMSRITAKTDHIRHMLESIAENHRQAAEAIKTNIANTKRMIAIVNNCNYRIDSEIEAYWGSSIPGISFKSATFTHGSANK